MTTLRIHVSPRSLATSNAALDLDASAVAYAARLGAILRDALPHVTIEVRVDPSRESLTAEATAPDEPTARALERDALDYAWVVRQCEDWSRLAGDAP